MNKPKEKAKQAKQTRAVRPYRKRREFVCDCGCEGDYTDHTMRLGERGM